MSRNQDLEINDQHRQNDPPQDRVADTEFALRAFSRELGSVIGKYLAELPRGDPRTHQRPSG